MFDLADWHLHNTTKAKEQMESRREYFVQIRQAAVSAEHLTGDPHWDKYQSYVQGLIQQAQGELENARERICRPDVVDAVVLMGLKGQIAKAQGKIEAYEAVLGLPVGLIESGKQAKKLMGDKN